MQTKSMKKFNGVFQVRPHMDNEISFKKHPIVLEKKTKIAIINN